jgi:hypothetical protein
MLTFKFLIINDVDIWKNLLTSVLTFKSLAINDVDLVDLYMRICHIVLTPLRTFFKLIGCCFTGRLYVRGISRRLMLFHLEANILYRPGFMVCLARASDLAG